MRKKLFLLLAGLTLLPLLLASPAGGQGVNDFTISDYRIDFVLGRDETERSVLTTKERITAEFSEEDINHGIERAIPTNYDGHPTSLRITSVTDESGKPISYSTYRQNGMKILRIGDADTYVHGTQTYVIEYAQRDVTRLFRDTDSDEFYWDTNGTGWNVPIDRLAVNLTLADGLKSALNGNTACYQGAFDATDACELQQTDTGFSASAANLQPGENITMAVGFKPNTFTPYSFSLRDFVGMMLGTTNGTVITAALAYGAVQVFLTILSVLFIAVMGVRFARWHNRTSELDPVITEYIPPKDASVTTAARLMGSQRGFAAQLIDFAVRHYIKIYQTKPKRLFSAAEYELEIVKPIDSLLPEEQEVLSDIFDGRTNVGDRLAMSTLKNNSALSVRMQDNSGKLTALMREKYGLRHKDEEKRMWFHRAAKRTGILALILLSPALLIVSITAFVLQHTLWPLTDTGLALKRYLRGLKQYISVAEAERLGMLQSAEGAAKVPAGTAENPAELVKLYERVLPYAVLFGQEKSWNIILSSYYQQTNTQPDWINGTNGMAFSAASFSSAVSSFSSTAAFSSASGGSSGGGSSGGGGGGGGGGGW